MDTDGSKVCTRTIRTSASVSSAPLLMLGSRFDSPTVYGDAMAFTGKLFIHESGAES